MKTSAIKAFAPATISNLCCGFDLLGLALEEWGDHVIIRPGDRPGVSIGSIRGSKSGVPLDPEKNTAALAAKALLSHIDRPELSISLDIHKGYTHSSGLGSSAASAVAAVVALNHFLGRPFKEKKSLLPFALAGERGISKDLPLDNIAASLLGGLQLTSPEQSHVPLSLPTPDGLYIVVIHPDLKTATADERGRLSPAVPLKEHIRQVDAMAQLILGLYRTNWDLISAGLNDFIIEPQRSPGLPFFNDFKTIALEHDCLGCSISGSGPAVFAIYNNSIKAQSAEEALKNMMKRHQIECRSLISKVNNEGAKVC